MDFLSFLSVRELCLPESDSQGLGRENQGENLTLSL